MPQGSLLQMRTRVNYPDGQRVVIGDRITFGPAAQPGSVVCSIDDGAFSDGFPAGEWMYLETGVLIRFDNGALLHLSNPDQHGLRRAGGSHTGRPSSGSRSW